MNAKEYLKEYKKELDPLLSDYFKHKKKKFREMDQLAEEAVAILENFTLSGGKRIRPALVYYGYLLGGGKINENKKKDILFASMSIELIHSFLLIHDDIIDRDNKRHGVDTVHEYYKKIAQRFFSNVDQKHFGNSMAIIAGDLSASMANEILFDSNFAPEIILKALKHLQKVVYTTIPGEMLDVFISAKGEASEQEILKVHEGKTAFYTFEGPLHLGIILSGNDSEDLLENISKYSLAVGKAFQLRDDILGVFGDEKKLGKPVGSDIVEGKQTLLLLRALKNGNDEQQKILKTILRKDKINPSELENFRKIIVETGALKYSEDLIEKLSLEAVDVVRKTEISNENARDFLVKIAEYIGVRTH